MATLEGQSARDPGTPGGVGIAWAKDLDCVAGLAQIKCTQIGYVRTHSGYDKGRLPISRCAVRQNARHRAARAGSAGESAGGAVGGERVLLLDRLHSVGAH